ncbi:class F sortase [Candidatus Saccharibacteria bacterium]|nr:class F sortase [Candidatus Saccharibacteria bacterium]
MELKRGFRLRTILIALYVVMFILYVIYGLRPTDAIGTSNQKNISKIVVPSISLESDVEQLELHNGKLITPNSTVGKYSQNSSTTLLIGHSSAVFSHLHEIRLGDQIWFDEKAYEVKKIRLSIKEDIDMEELLKPSEQESLVLMTCAGQMLADGDATFRLIVFASV